MISFWRNRFDDNKIVEVIRFMELKQKSIKNRFFFIISGSALLLISFFLIFNFKDSKPQTYKDISLKELQMKLDSEKDIKVYVYKTSCVACQELKPILDQVISKNQLNIFALNMDIEENIDVTFLNKNKIFRTPTLLHFKNGEEVDRLLGVQTKQDLNQFLNK